MEFSTRISGGYRPDVAGAQKERLVVDRSAAGRQKPLLAGPRIGREVMTLTEQIRAVSPPSASFLVKTGELALVRNDKPAVLPEEGAA